MQRYPGPLTTAEIVAWNFGAMLARAGTDPAFVSQLGPGDLPRNEGGRVARARIRLGPPAFVKWVRQGYWSNLSEG